ncbi:MAG: MerR family transcriptional regulator [Actinomycetota bacterium]|nr:MerR family transcriptional regulator [Actinomycetota bacterium]
MAPDGADRRELRQIGDVANLVGLSLRTVRHYEDAGLVLPAARTAGGFRLYGDEAIGRLRLIMQMKPLGFSLEEMRLLIEARAALASGAVAADERRDLEGRVAMFAAAATEKCDELRASLAVAEAFSDTLAAEVASFDEP